MIGGDSSPPINLVKNLSSISIYVKDSSLPDPTQKTATPGISSGRAERPEIRDAFFLLIEIQTGKFFSSRFLYLISL